MKKIILLFSFVTLISCSNTDEQGSNAFVDTNNILVKKAVNSSANYILEYIYDGKKLMKINTNSGIYIAHTYNGDLITKAAQYYDNNQLILESIYEYDSNNKIKSVTSIDSSNSVIEKIIYTYNLDNTVSYEIYNGNNLNQVSRTGKIWLDSNGEILKSEQYQNGILAFRNENLYDDKNYLFKNVKGFNKLLLSNSGIKRNIISSKTYDSDNLLTTSFSNNIIYDLNNFPKTIETTLNTGSVSTVQYFYE